MFNQLKLMEMRKDLEAALKAVEDKHGVKFELGRITYDEKSFQGKLKCVVVDPGTVVKSVRDLQSEQYFAKLVKDNPDLGKSFTHKGQTLKIVGYDRAKRKFPWVVEYPNGKKMLFTDQVLGLLGIARLNW